MRHPRATVSLLFGILSFAATASTAQDKPAMTIVQLLEIPRLSEPQLSPDGDSLVYRLAEADWEKNKRVSHLWLQRIGGGDPIQLTRGDKGESTPRWSPDGKTIAFIAERGDDENQQIYLLGIRGGEARRLSEHETSVSDIEWAPDGSSLYFVAKEPKSEEEKKRDKVKDDVFSFDEDWKHQHLWRVAAETGKEEQLTEGDFSIGRYSLSRDGSRIVVHRAPSPLLDDRWSSEIYLLDGDGANGHRLTNNAQPESGAEISPDGQTVLFLADTNATSEPYYNTNLFLVPASGGDSRMLLEDMPHEVQSAAWSADGDAIYLIANTGVRSQLFRVDVGSEDLAQLTEGDHSLRAWSYLPKLDTHIASVANATNAGDVWRQKGGVLEKLTAIYDHYAEETYLPRQEAITWKGADGETVEGLLYYPQGYEPGKRYPLAVQTHGGPRSSDRFGFPRWGSYVPVLTARGWLVFKPNYRGSTGYGDAYLRDMVGHYFNQAHLDVMTGVDHLIAEGMVDSDRMIKMGWSGGGHMTNKIVTHTNRFKAASSGAGASNWVSMYGQTDIRVHRGNWFGGSPWREDSDIGNYWRSSALSKVWKVTTPTLVLVGQNDKRVPAPQSVEFYRALRANGVDTHLYMAPREPHGWRELRHELFKINVELDWFERHALGKDYEWEVAPGDDDDETLEEGVTATASSGG